MFGLLTEILLTKKRKKSAHYFLAGGEINKTHQQHICMWNSGGSSCKSLSSGFCFLVSSPYYHSSFSALSRWLPADTSHPRRPPSQHFVNFWQLFFIYFLFFSPREGSRRSPCPSPLYHSIPRRTISPGVMAAEACKIPPPTPPHGSPRGTTFYQEGRKRKSHWIMNESQSAVHLSSSDTADINAVSVPHLPAI